MDFVYARYDSSIWEVDAPECFFIYVKGKNKEVEQMVYMQWVALLPRGFSDKSLYSFKTFLDKATGKDIDNRPAEMILNEIDEAMRRLEENGK